VPIGFVRTRTSPAFEPLGIIKSSSKQSAFATPPMIGEGFLIV